MRKTFIKSVADAMTINSGSFDIEIGIEFDGDNTALKPSVPKRSLLDVRFNEGKGGGTKGGIAAFICGVHYKHGLTPERLKWVINFYGSLEEAAARICRMNESQREILDIKTWEDWNYYVPYIKYYKCLDKEKYAYAINMSIYNFVNFGSLGG